MRDNEGAAAAEAEGLARQRAAAQYFIDNFGMNRVRDLHRMDSPCRHCGGEGQCKRPATANFGARNTFQFNLFDADQHYLDDVVAPQILRFIRATKPKFEEAREYHARGSAPEASHQHCSFMLRDFIVAFENVDILGNAKRGDINVRVILQYTMRCSCFAHDVRDPFPRMRILDALLAAIPVAGFPAATSYSSIKGESGYMSNARDGSLWDI